MKKKELLISMKPLFHVWHEKYEQSFQKILEINPALNIQGEWGLSISCLITPDGQKLKSILVTKGLTSRSLIKYGNYVNDNQVFLLLIHQDKTLPHEDMIVLDLISKHMNGEQCMCIWDAYRAHQTPEIKKQAEKLNIKLLQVSKGMTPELQPLDINVTLYKMKMTCTWGEYRYNENDKDFHLNIRVIIPTPMKI